MVFHMEQVQVMVAVVVEAQLLRLQALPMEITDCRRRLVVEGGEVVLEVVF